MRLVRLVYRIPLVTVLTIWEIVSMLYDFSMGILPSIWGKILFVLAIGWVIFWAFTFQNNPLAFAAAIFGPPLFVVGVILFCAGMAWLDEWDKKNLIKRGLY